MPNKRMLDYAAYAVFIGLILCAPLVLEEFWLNRIAKFLVYGLWSTRCSPSPPRSASPSR